ncbi:MAG: hypothetical protein COY40_03600, partial [Alphaproteobacteria bacterium CG_4_10_14_0_8_um_filter_53_9]
MPISKPSSKSSLFAARGRATFTPRDRERFFFFMGMMMKTGQTTSEALRAVAKSFKSEKQEEISS